jgi:hypothetical protein
MGHPSREKGSFFSPTSAPLTDCNLIASTNAPRSKREKRSMQLFVAKDREGINAGGAECGNHAGRKRYKNEEHGDSQKSYEVDGVHCREPMSGIGR